MGGEAAEDRCRSPVGGIGGELLFLAGGQIAQARVGRTEAELAIEPECAGRDGLLVLVADLVGVEREGRHAERLPEKLHGAGEDPRGLPLSEGVIQIEAQFHPFEEGQRFEIADRDSVLDEKTAVSGAEREAAAPLGPDEVDQESPARVGLQDGRGIAEGEGVILAVAQRRRFTRCFQDRERLLARQPPDRKRRRGDLRLERDVPPRDQRRVVKEDPSRRRAHPGARHDAGGKPPA